MAPPPVPPAPTQLPGTRGRPRVPVANPMPGGQLPAPQSTPGASRSDFGSVAQAVLLAPGSRPRPAAFLPLPRPPGHSQLLQSPQPEEGAVLQHRDLVVAQEPVGKRAQGGGQGRCRYLGCDRRCACRVPVGWGGAGKKGPTVRWWWLRDRFIGPAGDTTALHPRGDTVLWSASRWHQAGGPQGRAGSCRFAPITCPAPCAQMWG